MYFPDPIPVNYDHDNEQIAQYADISPDMTMPERHIFIGATTKQGWNQMLLATKGFTHYDKAKAAYESGTGNENYYESLIPGRKYWAVPRINDIFGMTSSTTKEQAEAFADQMPLDPLIILESQENVNYLAPNAIQWKWFHDRCKARRDAQTAIDGIKRYMVHNYFRFVGGIFSLGQQGWEKHRELYTTPVENWSSITYIDGFGNQQTAVNDYSPGYSLSSTNLITEGYYPNNPDADADILMTHMFSMEVSRMQGFSNGIFLFGVREWRPGFFEGTYITAQGGDPAGRFLRMMKHKIAPEILILCAFISHEFNGTRTGAGIEYGEIAYQPVNKKPIEYYDLVHAGMDKFLEDGETEYSEVPQGYYGGTGFGRYQFGGGDFFYFGTRYWNETQGPLSNVAPVFLEFRENGGPWVTKAINESDLIDARRDRRRICRGRVSGNQFSFWTLNVYANHAEVTLEIKHPTNPNIIITRKVSGNGVHSELITIGSI